MKKGVFITLEGNDGAGKTTVCMGLKKELEARGYSVIYTREPGGSKIAEEIRNILLSDENENMDPRTEACCLPQVVVSTWWISYFRHYRKKRSCFVIGLLTPAWLIRDTQGK